MDFDHGHLVPCSNFVQNVCLCNIIFMFSQRISSHPSIYHLLLIPLAGVLPLGPVPAQVRGGTTHLMAKVIKVIIGIKSLFVGGLRN